MTTTRQITEHQINECNENIEIGCGPLGDGGASHVYDIKLGAGFSFPLSFQDGLPGEVGTNGVTIEALLAICADRLRGFQLGKFSCRENACALTKIDEALMWLHKRTRERDARGVEGTYKT